MLPMVCSSDGWDPPSASAPGRKCCPDLGIKAEKCWALLLTLLFPHFLVFPVKVALLAPIPISLQSSSLHANFRGSPHSRQKMCSFNFKPWDSAPSVSPGHGVLAPEDWSPVGSAPWGGNATGLFSCAGASFLSSQRGFGTERFGFRVPAMPVDAWAPCVGLFHVWDRILTFPSRGGSVGLCSRCLVLGIWKNVTQAVEEKPEPPTVEEIKEKIEKYNAKVTNCLLMKLSDDGTYTGFIKVHLKLRRPVTVPAGIRPQSIYDALKEVNLAETTDRRTSFYLPLDAIKQLHISSTTTVSEVIQGLLKKFMVVDNPQKFALFKEMRKDGQVLLQKLPLTEFPLYLRLLAGPDTDVLSFVLKENETGEVEWDAFSIPELQNFLMILDKEEKDKIQQVKRKYEKFKQRLQQSLKEAGDKPG
ncbi:ras association domain-containing protein 5 isoform X1 [Lagopus muta]|uniref:ras association domain-containing protein 5 isoform X1 n=1 Tax=Lagopus muta TaxID=64668 RepID=UPI00209C8911|nr:ras association domain-containing protein 5 isoform X1 [Lagopus muta]